MISIPESTLSNFTYDEQEDILEKSRTAKKVKISIGLYRVSALIDGEWVVNRMSYYQMLAMRDFNHKELLNG